MPSKSVFRQPGVKHFQLVHRSQRDPLINDPEATQHVLKQIDRGQNSRVNKPDSPRDSFGEAALYGVYYDDTTYDYMQHLRPVGLDEGGGDSVLMEAPTRSKGKGKGKGKTNLLSDLPSEALPSAVETPRNYESQQAIPESIAGFQPNMDPHLRQTLEALDDDAFVDVDLKDDFFSELLADGERDDNDNLDSGFHSHDVNETYVSEMVSQDEMSWEERFVHFKQSWQTERMGDGVDDEDESEGADTVGQLPELSVLGGKKRRRGAASDASGYSMSSSSLSRNEGLSTLDEKFDQVEREYAEDDDADDDEGDEDLGQKTSDDDSDEVPQLTAREDFNSMLDDFLGKYEILGGKMRPKLEGENGVEKLETLRRAMRMDDDGTIRHSDERQSTMIDSVVATDSDEKDRWDCETVLTTYTNQENHPRLLRVREAKPVIKIQLDPRTGMPTSNIDATGIPNVLKNTPARQDHPSRSTITRPRIETPEERKTRKAAVKAERQDRRVEKKQTTTLFSVEKRKQLKDLSGKTSAGVRKLG